jgi:Ca2+-binding RTX toxin-like protein
MSTSFVVNLGDLNKILEQIKIAERNAAGEALVDIIGQDAALLPLGLRTVDGTYNHLLPGQQDVGAADELFTRLLTPVYRNETDDHIALGPGPQLTNGNYNPLTAPTLNIVDADPRIISNLIVDQTLNNRAALIAALAVAGAENPSDAAQDILDARADMLANPNDANKAAIFNGLIGNYDLEISSDGSVMIEHRSADIGLSPPNSGWMTFFGQFFDHGLDLVTKGGSGTIYMPLENDDPLVLGPDGKFGTLDDLNPNLRFMVLTRTTAMMEITNPDGSTSVVPVPGGRGTESQNTTTPFVDQNQTYTSVASHQVFLREYEFTRDNPLTAGTALDSYAMNTGHLLDGARGGIATWGEVKAQAVRMLGLTLSDIDVNDVPLLAVDEYGNFIAGPNGYAQVYVTVRLADANNVVQPNSQQPGQFLMEGQRDGLDLHNLPPFTGGGLPTPPSGMHYVATIQGTGHAFLNDIAHNAVPGTTFDTDNNPATQGMSVVQADADHVVGTTGGMGVDVFGNNTSYDDELLASHFATGDGRGNENIGLTTVHTVFHSEHNRLVEVNKDTIIASNDVAIINEWLRPANAITRADLNTLNGLTGLAHDTAVDALHWNGDRLFQAARFVTEMQYQHLVFEEFARRIQPNVDPFVFTNSADLNPAILAEFAHTVYRFGHSMLTDTVDRLDNQLHAVDDPSTPGPDDQPGLIAAFLNPQMFSASSPIDDATAAGAIIRGMTRQVGSEIDEFVVEALRNNLLGLPLDLPALNIARGRDTGIPSLNDARAEIYAMTGAADVKPYTSWIDFAQHIKHPVSVINFIAAYGTHPLITAQTTLNDRRAAAMAIVLGEDQPNIPNANGVGVHTIFAPDALDRAAFLNATGIYAPDGNGTHDDSRGGLNLIDLWIGGLAEEINEFGGQLGSTFNYIFEYQMEHLQNGDRFYYLSRTQGMNLLNLLEPNTFTDLVMRNTDLGALHATHLPGALMSAADMIIELDPLAGQENYNSEHPERNGTNPSDRSLLDPIWEEDFQQAIDPKLVRDIGHVRQIGGVDQRDIQGVLIRDGGVLKFSGGEHVVLGGTEGNDSLFGDKGIDTLWGDGGDDYLNAGMESDQVFGGDGDDIIEDPFGDNFLRGEAGNDVIVSDTGLTLLFGGEGQDFVMGVTDAKEFFAGPGNDFILGGTDADTIMGNEGDDWVEGGEGFDDVSGGNSELFFNSVVDGNDILNGQGNDTDYDGENGDDIMVDGPGIQRNNGMDGFDWAIFKGDTSPVDADLGVRPFDTRQALILRDRFDSVEGLSGWNGNDILTGASKLLIGEGFTDKLDQAGVERIHGLRAVVDPLNLHPNNTANAAWTFFESDLNEGGEIILGGEGNDTIRGNLGDDILDGDAWLNVRIAVHPNKDATGLPIASFDSLTQTIPWNSVTMPPSWRALDNHGGPTNTTYSLAELMRIGAVNPGQLEAVREIITTEPNTGFHGRDIAVFSDIFDNYTIETTTPGAIASATTIGDGDGDGFISVRHTPTVGAGGGAAAAALRESDGNDLIRNFEILAFADKNMILDPLVRGAEHASTGLLSITLNPDTLPTGANVGDTFVAGIGTVHDQDVPGGIPSIAGMTLAWEFEATPGQEDWEAVTDPVTGDPVFGPRFTPTPLFELDGLRLRVVGRFNDGLGVPEVVFSLATAPLAAQAVAAATDGDDFLVGTNGPDTINALAGDDEVLALGGNDVVIGGPGSDLLDGGLGNGDVTVFFGPLSNFTFVLDPDGNLQVVDAATGDEDTVINFERLVFIDTALIPANQLPLTDTQIATLANGGTVTGVPAAAVVSQNVADVVRGVFFDGNANANTPTASEFNDVIFGNGGDDVIDGLGGNDLLVGGDGDDDIDSGGGNDKVSGGDGANTIRLRTGDETLVVALNETGTDTVRNDGGIETLSIGAVAVEDLANRTGYVRPAPGVINSITAQDDGAGNLNVVINGANGKTVIITDHFNDADSVLEQINFNGSTLDGVNLGTENYNLVAAAAGVNTLTGTDGKDALFGTGINDNLSGGAGNDLLLGGLGVDTLNGEGGDDILDGGAGNDLMNGGDGDDTYVVDANGDSIVEGSGSNSGIDTVVRAVGDITLGDYANVENATLTGTGNSNATGTNGVDNVLTGNAGNNTLDGRGGADTAVFNGAAVAATFGLTTGANGGVTVATTGGGVDTLQNIERVRFGSTTYNLVAGTTGNDGTPTALTGTAADDLILGFDGNDFLSGGTAGNDFLDGGAGVDDMTGGTGDDTYVISVAGDVVHENGAGGGIDTVSGALSLNLANYNNVENVTLTGSADGLTAGGTGGSNVLTGNAGTNTLTGLEGDDTYVVTLGDTIVETAGGGTADTVSGELSLDLTDTAHYNNVENLTLLGTGDFAATGNAGNNVITGNSGANIIVANEGNDTIRAGAGNDSIIWDIDNAGPSDGRDIVDGGTEIAGSAGDIFTVDGNSESEVYGVYSNTDDWDDDASNGILSSAAHAGLTGLQAGTEIVITRSVGANPASIIAELSEIEEIVINTRAGTNTVTPVGNFNGTALNFSTITVNDDGGSTTVDVSQMTSAHHVAFHTSGTDDTFIGARPQDEMLPDGATNGGTVGGGGNGGGGNGGGGDDVVGNGALHLNASDIAAIKNLINGLPGGEDNDAVGIRDLEGTGNNRAHPEYGSADQPFIRLTDAHYGSFDPATQNYNINPLFAGLDARAISNTLGHQEAGLPTSAQGVNSLFTAFGQYFDHGLDFLGKGGNGTITIGGAGTGHAPGTDNPADLSRGRVDSIVDGVPQHLNKTSPFVDQNQAYGSDELVGQFLREGDGHGGFTGRLFAGAPDPSNPDFNLLPTLRELIEQHWANNTVFTLDSGAHVAFRDYFAGLVGAGGVINGGMLPTMTSNFMGSGFPLLLDTNPFINLLDHYVAGDGRANENIALTAIHTIWARNHNYHVQELLDGGFTGTSEELFQAAKLVNEVEYQRVVFTEFADHLLGGIRGTGDHGFNGYNPDVDARVSHEFATAAYRFGHSLINQTMTVLDAQGNPQNVQLFDVFLNPTNDLSAFTVALPPEYHPQPGYEQLGINGILGGGVIQAAEEVDVNIVDAVRNDLVRTAADVFAFDVARDWDVGLGSMNQVRADLLASTDPYVREAVGFAGNLTPYSSWEDFQARNNLSDAVINQFRQAYPDLVLAAADIAAFQQINPGIVLGGPNHDTVRGIDRVDLFVGGLAESHINGGVVGQTFWVILHEQLDRLQEGDRLYYLDRVENLDFYQTVEEQGFASIIARNTGLTNLPQDIFATSSANNDDGGNTNNPPGDDNTNNPPGGDGTGNGGGGDDDGNGNGGGDDDNDGNGNGDDDGDGNGDDDTTGGGDTGTGGNGTGTGGTNQPVVDLVLAGTGDTNVLVGGAGDDSLAGLGGDDVVVGNAGADAITGGDGSDLLRGGDGRDMLFGGAGDDQVFGGNHSDVIYGDAGVDRLFGEGGDDMITAGAGDDSVFGGDGNDLFVAEVNDGNDVYFGDNSDGGTGIDTLDMSAAIADTFVNLGSGDYAHGSATSAQTGNDTLWGIENVNTGSGNDTIVASNAVNIMNGGNGNDTFKFPTAAAADGDTILGFAPGDRIDLSAIDANTGTAANDAFTLVTGAEFTAAGQLAVSFETHADGANFTVIQGNIDGNMGADFRIEVEGHHEITSNVNVIL